MQTLFKQSIAVVLAIVGCHVSAGQKIQCSINSSGQYEATLAWRNTLGSTKANALCAASNKKIVSTDVITEVKQPNSAANSKPVFEFTAHKGEKASDALKRWATSNNYKIEWNVPVDFDSTLSSGSFNAATFIDGVTKFINGLNLINKDKKLGLVEISMDGNTVKIIEQSKIIKNSSIANSFQYDVLNTDQTIRDVLVRWANSSNWSHGPEHWTIDRDLPISGTSNGFQFGNDFVSATRKLLETTEMTDRPLQPCFYSNKILRVVPKAEICDRSK